MAGVIWWPTLCDNSSAYDAFWHDDVTLNTWTPDLTRCFQQTVLTWGSSGFLLLFGGPLCIWYCSQPTVFRWRDKSKINIAKLILASLVWLCNCLQMIFYIRTAVTSRTTTLASLSSSVILFAVYSLTIVLFHMEYKKGVHTSGVQQCYWSLQLAVAAIGIRSSVLQAHAGVPLDVFIAVTYYVQFAFLCFLWILVFISDKSVFYTRRQYETMEKSDEKTPLLSHPDLSDVTRSRKLQQSRDIEDYMSCPERTCSFMVNITYQWFLGIVYRGWKHYLVFDDLGKLLDRDKCKTLVPRFLHHWNHEVKKHPPKSAASIDLRFSNEKKKQKKGASDSGASLVRALLWTILTTFFKYNLFRFLSTLTLLVNPILLRQLLLEYWTYEDDRSKSLLQYIQSEDPYTWKGLVLAAAMFLASSVKTIIQQRFLYHGFNAGMHLRTVTTAVVYRKSLRLSSAARKQTTVGEIVNLMAVDANRLQMVPSITTVFWSMPLLGVISVLMLWFTMGPSAFIVLAVLAVIILLNGILIANAIRKLQRKQMKMKDKRVRTMTEVLSGIRVLKLYAWENSFADKINTNREGEIKTIKMINILNAISGIVWNNCTYIMSLAVFATYVLSSTDNMLNPDKVFVTFSIISIMNFPIQQLPRAVNAIGQALIAVDRITRFLLLEEKDPSAVVFYHTLEAAVKIEGGEFAWDRGTEPTLKDISLEVKKGELVAVVGQVGSGKSSLGAALLGEMIQLRGSVTLQDLTSYVPQQAWIQNKTLRENVLFGKPFEEDRYREIIDGCALIPDLAILTDGDHTEIGEKGINLSGGQKQRVSLARAVYQDTSMYLLDDPLSAVDAHVAKHLYDKIIGPNGLLKDKTRILITHSVKYLPYMDRIVVMKDGRISECGSYDELLQSQGAFSKFLLTYLNDHTDSDPESIEQLKVLREKLRAEDAHSQSSGKESQQTAPSHAQTLQNRRRRGRKDSHRSAHSEREAEKGRRGKRMRLADDGPGKLIKQEKEDIGSIKASVLKDYARAGGVHFLALVILCHLSFLAFLIMGQLWLSEWSEDPSYLNKTEQEELRNVRLGVYGGLISSQVLSLFIGVIAVAVSTAQASRVYHSRLVARILRAPMSFFDTTPLGRILNRCAKDVDNLDTSIPQMIRTWFYALCPLFASVFIISYSTPIFLVIFVPVGIVFIIIQKLYIKTARQIRRIDSVRRSPIFTHFDESVTGSTSIRAYGRVEEFIHKCDVFIDDSQRAWYHVIVAMRWLGLTMELVAGVITFSAAAFAVLQRYSIGAGLAGLSVSYSLQISQFLNMYIRSSTELETYMVAAERIKEYSELDTEAAYEIEETKPDDDWPENGVVKYEGYSTRYRPGLDLVLNEVTFTVKPSEKIGVVGRTGAGKSSLALSLFRIIEAATGSINIDGVQIAQLGLLSLRSRLTIIPQDPVVFSGNLRFNLDPLRTLSDSDLWKALDLAHLKTFVKQLPAGLNYECGEGGEGLSVGQRQLLCLARALLRKSKILVLDEATSGVDLETDDLIQNTIRIAFKECTVITIAHRVNTILDYDRVLVMENGAVKEFDSPSVLLQRKSSAFYALAKDAGVTEAAKE